MPFYTYKYIIQVKQVDLYTFIHTTMYRNIVQLLKYRKTVQGN